MNGGQTEGGGRGRLRRGRGEYGKGISNLETTLSNTVNDWYSRPTQRNLKGKNEDIQTASLSTFAILVIGMRLMLAL